MIHPGIVKPTGDFGPSDLQLTFSEGPATGEVPCSCEVLSLFKQFTCCLFNKCDCGPVMDRTITDRTPGWPCFYSTGLLMLVLKAQISYELLLPETYFVCVCMVEWFTCHAPFGFSRQTFWINDIISCTGPELLEATGCLVDTW
jgi:hypothetical protein